MTLQNVHGLKVHLKVKADQCLSSTKDMETLSQRIGNSSAHVRRPPCAPEKKKGKKKDYVAVWLVSLAQGCLMTMTNQQPKHKDLEWHRKLKQAGNQSQ